MTADEYGEKIAVVGFNTHRIRPVANKKFDEPRKAAAYILELLLRKNVEFMSVRKVLDVTENTIEANK